MLLPGLMLLPAAAAAGDDRDPQSALGGAAVEVRVDPPSLVLDGPRDARRIIISARGAEGPWVDFTRAAAIRPADDRVRADADGYWVPVRGGETRLLVQAAGREVEVPVIVRGLEMPPPVRFVRDVMPVLDKVGCTAGTCHGSAKGKNGFKMSLRGYDPEFDYRALTTDLAGRRVNPAEPSQSLMLLKPMQEVAHQGGLVIEEGSRYQEILHRWISEGAHYENTAADRVARLEVIPSGPMLPDAGFSQQLLVIAHYGDGSTRDVTREAVYSASAISIAAVTPGGLVTALRRGEAAVIVRYEGTFGISNAIVLGDRRGFAWKEVPEYNFIDGHIHDKLKLVKVLPSELCTDAEFLRRAAIDLIGVPPTPEEVRQYLAEPGDSRAKRERWIARLMDRPEFVDHWALKWADLLQVNQKYLGQKGIWTFQNWIRQAVAANRPLDRFVAELLTASGSTYENPASNFYRIAREPTVALETTTQLFLGVRMMCAKCHDHPFEQWTQNNYYELAAFFARVGIKPGARPGEEIIYEKRDGSEVTHPKGNRVMEPDFPFHYRGEAALTAFAEDASLDSRRVRLAGWLTSPENPYFARSIVNRVWSYFFGRGIIDPVDDIRSSNPPSNPELLAELTEKFIQGGFDMRALIQTIVSSRTYQLSTRANDWNRDDGINFSHALPRRLGAEELLDAIAQASGSQQLRFQGVPADFTAAQTPDPKFDVMGFLELFGRPPRESPCECERRSEVSLSQTLSMINGELINKAVGDPRGRMARLAQAGAGPEKILEEAYLAAFCRLPDPEERERGLKFLGGVENLQEGGQDLLWALINSPAFLFNR